MAAPMARCTGDEERLQATTTAGVRLEIVAGRATQTREFS